MPDDESTEALKPCPFCGSSAAELTEAMGDAWVRCPSCGASAGMSGHTPLAVKNWNARAAYAPLDRSPPGSERTHPMHDDGLAWAAWHPVKGFGPTPNACWDVDEAIRDAKVQSELDDSPDWIAVRVEIRRVQKDASNAG